MGSWMGTFLEFRRNYSLKMKTIVKANGVVFTELTFVRDSDNKMIFAPKTAATKKKSLKQFPEK